MRLLSISVAAALLTVPIAAAPIRPASPNILLIVLDTMRYDAVSPQNTPFLDSLKSRSVVFTDAYATHDFTPPSHFSMMTGLANGLDGVDDRIENSVPYQLHAMLNYDTFATAANGFIRPRLMPTFRAFGRFNELSDDFRSDEEFLDARTDFDMRLALFRCPRTSHAEAKMYTSGSRILPQFLQQLRTARAPYFGFINLMDLHEPYVPDPSDYPPEKSLPAGFSGDPLHRRVEPELMNPDAIADPVRREYIKAKIAQAGSPAGVAIDMAPESIVIYHRRYLATVRELDAMLRDFFATLERAKQLDNTYVIITSDHGESFGEAGLITHNFGERGDYESTHHVPLIIVLPPNQRAAATVVTRRVSNAAIAPTIYDLARLDIAPLRQRYASYPPSLVSLFTHDRSRRVATVVLPKPAAAPDAYAAEARAAMLRSLGYLQ